MPLFEPRHGDAGTPTLADPYTSMPPTPPMPLADLSRLTFLGLQRHEPGKNDLSRLPALARLVLCETSAPGLGERPALGCLARGASVAGGQLLYERAHLPGRPQRPHS